MLAVFGHFCGIIGSRGDQLCSIDFAELDLPSVDSSLLDQCRLTKHWVLMASLVSSIDLHG
jgi:hypothetical protein